MGEADAGEYDVVLTNSDGTLTSGSASLTVLDRVPGLFNSGVDASGVALFDDEIDPHYTLVVNPNGGGTDALAMGALPGAWVANSANSRWIGPTPDTNGAQGLYTFRTTFDLLGFDPATAVIFGRWTSDNAGVEVRLNGVPTGITGTGEFTNLFEFEINSGFVAGINTLEFDINNAGEAANPIGLRIEDLQVLGTFEGLPDFRITSVTQPAGDPLSVSFTWASTPGAKYRLEVSRDLANWSELADSVDSNGDSTTFVDAFFAGLNGQIFYRVIRLP